MIVPVDEAEDADDAEDESSSIGVSGSSLGVSISSSSSASLNSGGANFASLGLTKDRCKSLILKFVVMQLYDIQS